jgi:hypothetical protein
MDVPTSPRQNAANPPNPSNAASSSAPGAQARAASAAAPGVPFASLLAAAKGRLGKAAVAGHRGASVGRGAGAIAMKKAEGGDGGALEAAGHRRGAGAKSESERGSEGASERGSEGEGEGGGVAKGRAGLDEMDVLDPAARHAAQLAPPGVAMHVEATSPAANEPVRARSLEELLPALVRRIAWAGDRNKGTVRLELGAGAYAGTTVMVHADGGRVRVELGGTEGPELDRLRARLDTRLRGHGLDVESVT